MYRAIDNNCFQARERAATPSSSWRLETACLVAQELKRRQIHLSQKQAHGMHNERLGLHQMKPDKDGGAQEKGEPSKPRGTLLCVLQQPKANIPLTIQLCAHHGQRDSHGLENCLSTVSINQSINQSIRRELPFQDMRATHAEADSGRTLECNPAQPVERLDDGMAPEKTNLSPILPSHTECVQPTASPHQALPPPRA
jgi:hypothetical protein